MKLKQLLLESGLEKHFMTKTERAVKKKLIGILVQNHHVKYAKRLSLFDINIVPREVKVGGSDFTAAISFDEGVIFISEGFLLDETTFFQLDVLMRHELAHNLLMHQIRMIKKLGPELADHFSTSSTLHGLLNIIEDLEISNTRYTEKDKDIVRKMWLNGRLIGGLVTEDHRKSWMYAPLEAMYTELAKEIEQVNKQILATMDDPNGPEAAEIGAKIKNNDFITLSILDGGANYTKASGAPNKPSRASGTLRQFIDGNAYIFLGVDPHTGKPSRINYKDLNDIHKKVLADVLEILEAPNSIYSDTEAIEIVIDELSKTSLIEPYILKEVDINGKHGSKIAKIISPEEKWLVMEFLKKASTKSRAKLKVNVKKGTHSQEYVVAHNKAIDIFDDNMYSDDDLEAILKALES